MYFVTKQSVLSILFLSFFIWNYNCCQPVLPNILSTRNTKQLVGAYSHPEGYSLKLSKKGETNQLKVVLQVTDGNAMEGSLKCCWKIDERLSKIVPVKKLSEHEAGTALKESIKLKCNNAAMETRLYNLYDSIVGFNTHNSQLIVTFGSGLKHRLIPMKT